MTEPPTYSPASPFADLVEGSLAGHRAAWQALVSRLERVVWKAVNMMTTDDDIRKDAFAATWLRLVERLGTIREPDKLPGWLTTTATNEVRQIIRQRGRQPVPVDWSAPSDVFASLLPADETDGEHDRQVVLDEVRSTVRRAFANLDEECRQILTVLVLADPPVPYREASETLHRPVGSLGPSRKRCLEKLRVSPTMQHWARGLDG